MIAQLVEIHSELALAELDLDPSPLCQGSTPPQTTTNLCLCYTLCVFLGVLHTLFHLPLILTYQWIQDNSIISILQIIMSGQHSGPVWQGPEFLSTLPSKE